VGDLPYALREAIIEIKPEWGNIQRGYQVDATTPGFNSIRTRTVGHPEGLQVEETKTKAN